MPTFKLAPTTPTKNTLERICVGLRDGKRWARELFTHWDSIIFPHANDSLGQVVSASHQAEQDELDDAMDVFDDAPSASLVGHPLYLLFSYLRVHLGAISAPFPTPHTRAGIRTRAAPQLRRLRAGNIGRQRLSVITLIHLEVPCSIQG